MDNSSLNPWLPLIGVLVGGLLTGGFAWLNSWLQHRRQADENRKKLYREKLQDLYEVVSEIKNSYNRTTGVAAISFAGRQPFGNDAGPPIPEKLQMLVSNLMTSQINGWIVRANNTRTSSSLKQTKRA